MPLQPALEAKQVLRRALMACHGDVHSPQVQAAIARLAALNTTPASAHAPKLMGCWQLISAPNFPNGEQQDDGSWQYTLGRLSFQMFRPQDLPVRLTQVFQDIQPLAGGAQQTHNLVTHFQASLAGFPPVAGIVRNLGVCQPEDDTTLGVQFTGGTLEPSPETDLAVWRQVFSASEPAQLGLGDRLQRLALKLIFGLGAPVSIDADSGKAEFHMPRSPRGKLKILYLDNELRIMQSQKENTITICDRAPQHP